MFPALIEAFNTDLAGAVQFTGVCILVLGFSNFLWYVQTCPNMLSLLPPCRLSSDMIRVPMQTSFGRRPVLLSSTLICLVSNIWRAVAKDYRSFSELSHFLLTYIDVARTDVPSFTRLGPFYHREGQGDRASEKGRAKWDGRRCPAQSIIITLILYIIANQRQKWEPASSTV